MKKRQINIKKAARITITTFVLLLANTLYMCNPEEPVLHSEKSDQQVMIEYILSEENADLYSEFGAMLVASGYSNLLAVRGPFTLFLPTNEAMQAFYAEMNITSYTDLSPDEMKRLIQNHLVVNEIRASEIGLGTLRDTNALGDFLATDFVNNRDIRINKRAIVINQDEKVANGYVHVVDKVLPPITDNLFDVLQATPGYSIFTEGLRVTGIDDTLGIITFPYGKYTARTRYTILAVPDSVYLQNGVNSITDLINLYSEGQDNYTELENGFYRYMEYHCLSGTYYFSQLATRNFPSLTYDNNVSMDLTDEYKINYNREDSTYTAFIYEMSNIPAKNGALHSVDGMLPVMDVVPKEFRWEVTDYLDFKQGDYYKLHKYAKFSDGENTFEYIKWGGDFLQYYYKTHDSFSTDYSNYDCLNMNGYWWLQLTLPKIQKGKWTLGTRMQGGGGYTDCLLYIDGVLMDDLFLLSTGNNPDIVTVEWEKTERHTLKIVGLNPSLLFWDEIVFKPAP